MSYMKLLSLIARVAEQISKRALELGIAIQAAQGACKEIEKLELELAEKYGFLYAQSQAA